MLLSIVLRWLARVGSIASTLLLAAFAFGGQESLRPTFVEAIGLFFFPVGVVVGFFIAWWWEGIGGAVTVTSLACFYVYMVARDGRLPTGPYFLLFAAPGFLHLANGLLQRNRTRPAPAA